MLLLELAAENQKTIISTLPTASSYDLGHCNSTIRSWRILQRNKKEDA
jgi:hypothetical protein